MPPLIRQVLKLISSDFTTKYQPSTSTKSIILNGNEIMTGGNIIIPMAISVLETTISMIRKGIKIMKPIVNAFFISPMAKAKHHHCQRNIIVRGGFDRGIVARVIHKQKQIFGVRLFEHEFLHRFGCFIKRFGLS